LGHSLAIRADGTVRGWGDNYYGQATVPADLGPATAIAAGLLHSLAIRADGTVRGWGWNDYGQATVPADLGPATAIAAGYYHSLAIRADGTVRGWGSNDDGQATVPADLGPATAIAAGESHSLAIRVTDCNANGVPDNCEITTDPSLDCDANGRLDACDPDFNDNGIPDACEDTDGDGVLDSQDRCPLVPGDAECAGCPPGVCTQPGPVSASSVSASLTCNGGTASSVMSAAGLPTAGGAVTVTAWADADVGDGGSSEFVRVSIEGTAAPDISGVDCGWQSRQFTVPASTFDGWIADGSIVLSALTGPNTDCFCQNAFRVQFDYVSSGIPPAGSDVDGDGVPLEQDLCPTVAGGPGCADGCPLNSCGVCRSAAGLPDCDGDGTPDVCEIAEGTPDCDADGIPDTCQGIVEVDAGSGNLGAPAGGQERSWSIDALPPASGEVLLAIDVRGDLDGQSEWVDVVVNGGSPRRYFEADGSDCPATPDRAEILFGREEFNALVGPGGTLRVQVVCPPAVDGSECKDAGLTVISLRYLGILPSADCDGNHRRDACELLDGSAPDCNDNGIIDSCDIDAGSADDIDGNGTPDSCQVSRIPQDFASIQDAIDAASPGEMRIVLVAPGDHPGPIDFRGKSIRLVGTGGRDATFLTGSGGAYSPVVLATSGEPAIALLEGFTVRGGRSGAQVPGVPGSWCGGGMLAIGSSITVRNCAFEDNEAGSGAGICMIGGGGRIEGTAFRQCSAAAFGGGAYLSDASAVLAGCEFSACSAGASGGGLFVLRGGVSVESSAIEANFAYERGGGLAYDPFDGAAVRSLRLSACSVVGNLANASGGGIYVYPWATEGQLMLVDTNVCSNSVRNVTGRYAATGTTSICDCIGDCNLDTVVNGGDLARVLTSWGAALPEDPADVDGDGFVNGHDLGVVLTNWGPCTN
jgi:hypothetical protein